MTEPSLVDTSSKPKSSGLTPGNPTEYSDRSPTHGGEPVSPTAPSPRSGDPQNRNGDFSNSESDTEASMASMSSPTSSLPLKRGAWSPQEDEKLIQLVETMQPLKWVHVAQEMRSRTSKQCRERYHNYLKPSLTRTPISKDEGRKIEELVAIHGKRWAEISRQLPGRSDNAIKNWWNAGFNRRRASQDQSSSANMILVKQPSPVQPQSTSNMHSNRGSDAQHKPSVSSGITPPVQPLSEDRTHSPSMHIPPPVQVMFSSMYSEPNNRVHSPMFAPYPPQSAQSHPQNHQMGQPVGQQLPLPHHHHHHHHHHHGHNHPSLSPYPLTPSQRAESRAESLARLSVTSMSSMGSRSNSVVEDLKSVSPAASPPPGTSRTSLANASNTPGTMNNLSATSSYTHTPEDPSLLFSRLRQNSDFRRSSVDSSQTDVTSLSHYSLGNNGGQGTIPNSRRQSLQPQVSAELASPQDSNQSSLRQSRLSIANLMNH